jgi:hypothetical protein
MPFCSTQNPAKQGLSTSAPFSLCSRALLVAIFAALVLLKLPGVLQGRLWAEDGLFLQDALQLPWWQALTRPHTGYIDVAASTAMLIATHITDLEHVAFVSVVIALIIQLCPAVLLVTGRCEWLQPRWVLVTALLLILAPPIAEEVWLSPVTSQYHLMVCTGLILAFRVGIGPIGVLQILLLALAGLTGPGPALAAPLFVIRACVDRSWPRATQAAVLSAGALIEIAVFCMHPEPGRHLGISASLLLRVIYVKNLLVPFLGPSLVLGVTNGSGNASVLASWPFLPIVASLLALSGLAIAVLRSRARDVQWLFAAGLVMMVLSYFGALGGQANLLNIYFGERYYYAPQILLSLTLLGVARTGPVIARSLATVLVGWLVLVAVTEYRTVHPGMAQGPSWRDQVALWRAEPERAITLWPSAFQIHLVPRVIESASNVRIDG